MRKVIESFSADYRWLSNFYNESVVLDGVTYASTEHAYQAAKTLDPEQRKWFIGVTFKQAKHLGYKVALREDWEKVKLGIMEDVIRQKFNNPELKEKLIATGDAELIEGNPWGDTFWGVCEGKGENHLGKILMKIRSELNEPQFITWFHGD